MDEQPRVLTMKELKEEMKYSLEYSDPHDPLTMDLSSSIKFSPGMKPIVDDEFFEKDDEAVAYILKTDKIYALVKDCTDDVKIVESFDEDEQLAPYTIYKG